MVIKFIWLLLIACFVSVAQAYVTFYNSSADTITLTYDYCDSSFKCGNEGVTSSIPPGVAYRDVNIVFPGPDNSGLIAVNKIHVVAVNGTSFDKVVPADNGFTDCYADKDSGLLFSVFEKDDDVFCATGTA